MASTLLTGLQGHGYGGCMKNSMTHMTHGSTMQALVVSVTYNPHDVWLVGKGLHKSCARIRGGHPQTRAAP